MPIERDLSTVWQIGSQRLPRARLPPSLPVVIDGTDRQQSGQTEQPHLRITIARKTVLTCDSFSMGVGRESVDVWLANEHSRGARYTRNWPAPATPVKLTGAGGRRWQIFATYLPEPGHFELSGQVRLRCTAPGNEQRFLQAAGVSIGLTKDGSISVRERSN